MAKSKKTKRVISEGVAHIHSSFNNTIITITDKQGKLYAGLLQGAPVLEVQERAHLLQLRLLLKKLVLLLKKISE